MGSAVSEFADGPGYPAACAEQAGYVLLRRSVRVLRVRPVCAPGRAAVQAGFPERVQVQLPAAPEALPEPVPAAAAPELAQASEPVPLESVRLEDLHELLRAAGQVLQHARARRSERADGERGLPELRAERPPVLPEPADEVQGERRGPVRGLVRIRARPKRAAGQPANGPARAAGGQAQVRGAPAAHPGRDQEKPGRVHQNRVLPGLPTI